jgi:poly(A) polymerase
LSKESHSAEAPAAAPEISEDRLDPDAVKVVRRLRREGHEAYLVGGCVRDALIGLRPKDFDIATSAHPQQVKDTFRNSRLIGRRFRLAHVFFRGGKIVEVSTFRANPLDELTDLPKDLLIRHDNVFGNAVEDARRRDFTINGLFYDLDSGRVVDHVEGKADLEAQLVRTIGDPDVRMREDPVRILRAIRFAAKCAFDLEPATFAAMKKHVHEIPRCAPPRVLEEVLKLVRCGAARRSFELLRDVGALKILLPPVAVHLEQLGPEAAERHLRALDALDAHVKVGEIPSDAVLLATLLMPLPREGAPKGPIPRPGPRPHHKRAEAATDAPSGGVDEAPPEAEGDADEGQDEDEEDLPDLEGELEALTEKLEAEDQAESAAANGLGEPDPTQAPLLEGALRAETELHDERLGGPGGIPAFSMGAGDVPPWSLPTSVVAPEVVLAEMVRTARLPRRIAERTRMILLAQPILSGERRKRRSKPQDFARQSIFPEALAVFELSCAATERGSEQLARWQAVFAGQDLSAVEMERPDAAEHGGGGKGDGTRRRRRRGGKRRGGKPAHG